MKHQFFIIIMLFALFPGLLIAKTTNIYVTGAYNGGGGTMDQLLENRLKETRKQMERLDPESENESVDSKDKLLEALKEIECKCGDEINLFFFGHGGDGKLIFTKNNGTDKISAEDLAEALGEAAKECCCKINIVIMACNSGSMIEPLFEEEEHIRSVYSSSEDGEKSYTIGEYDENLKFIDQGDWMKGFNSNLSAVPKGTSSAEAIAIASKSAKEKMPIQIHDKQHPQGWVKDTLDLWAHVQEEVKTEDKTGKKYVEVLIYEPEHLRGQVKKVYLIDGEIPEDLKECKWIQGRADFNNPEEPIDIVGPVTDAERPREKILAHVERRHSRGKYIKVHTRRPHWMFCKEQEIHPREGEKISKDVEKCLWIEQEVVIDDPNEIDSVYDDVIPSTPKFNVKFHIEKINIKEGWAKVKIEYPDWLGAYKYVKIPPEEIEKWKKLKHCDNAWAEITMSDQKGTRSDPEKGLPTAKDVRKTYVGKAKSYDYDVAMNPGDQPVYRSMSKVILPQFTTTNTGNHTADYNVQVSISEIDMSVFGDEISSMPIRDLVASFDPDHPTSNNYLLEQYFGTEMSSPLYKDEADFEDVEPAESREQEYRPFNPVPGKVYRILAKLNYEQDEVEQNNHTQILFYIPKQDPLDIPKYFVFTARGTGRTTGHIIDLIVENLGDLAESVTIGQFYIPMGNNGHQPLMVPGSYLVSLLPGETVTIPLYGFCLDISLPPAPMGASLLPFDQWLMPHMVGSIPTPDQPFGPNTHFVRSENTNPNLQITYSGTDQEFPYQIDINKYPTEAAPLLYYATEALLESANTEIAAGNFVTPISSDIDLSIETSVQQNLWFFTSTLDSTQEEPHDYESFEQRNLDEIEDITGVEVAEMPDEKQEDIKTENRNLFSGIMLIGEKAKIIKPTSL